MTRVLIITGYGLNCEAESAHAWRTAGANPALLHLNDLIADPSAMSRHQILMFIGGFSFGDHMTSGHVFAHRVAHHLRDELASFIDAGNLVLGICNGFQIMTKLGLLPAMDGQSFSQDIALMQNDCGTFRNQWVRLRFEPDSPCVFTRGLSFMDLPIRHGEGKVHVKDKALLDRMEEANCIPCRYADPATGDPARTFPQNPNGSIHAIAGVCDPTGRVFGMMPHPEAYLFREQHPQWDFGPVDGPDGSAIFRNAVEHFA